MASCKTPIYPPAHFTIAHRERKAESTLWDQRVSNPRPSNLRANVLPVDHEFYDYTPVLFSRILGRAKVPMNRNESLLYLCCVSGQPI